MKNYRKLISIGLLNKKAMSLKDRVIKSFKASEIFDRAKKEFGITKSFKSSGWLLPDGTLLDMSSGGSVAREPHDVIKKIFKDEELYQDPENYKEEGSFVRDKFMDFGAVRIVSEGGGVEMRKEPTPQQMRVIEDFFKSVSFKEIFVDLSGRSHDFKRMYDNTEVEREKAIKSISDYYSGRIGPHRSEITRLYHYADKERRILTKD